MTNFKRNTPYAQATILEFNAILQKDGGYLNSGEEERDFEVEQTEDGGGSEQQTRESTAFPYEGEEELTESAMRYRHVLTESQTVSASGQSPPPPVQLSNPGGLQNALPLSNGQDQRHPPQQNQPSSSTTTSYNPNPDLPPPGPEYQNLDLFHPLFDPEMLELFPDGKLPDLSLLVTSPFSLDYLDMSDWNGTVASASVGADAGAGADGSSTVIPGWDS